MYSDVAGSGVVQQEDKQALVEDVLLRGFPPLLQSQETLDFRTNAMLTPLQEVWGVLHECSSVLALTVLS